MQEEYKIAVDAVRGSLDKHKNKDNIVIDMGTMFQMEQELLLAARCNETPQVFLGTFPGNLDT